MCNIYLPKSIRYCWENIRPKKWKHIPYLWIALKLLEQLDIHMEKSKFWTLSHNIHKNYLEMNHRPKCKSSCYKTSRRKYSQPCGDQNFFFKKILIFNWRIIVLVSVIHQHESPIGLHMSLPSWISLPPPTSYHCKIFLISKS